MAKKQIITVSIAFLALSACGESGSSEESAEDQAASFESVASWDGVEIVDRLDRMPRAERPQTLMASVRSDEVLLTDLSTGEEAAIDLPHDEFYLSFAPYLTRTHDCYYHSLTTCTGELFNEEVDVTIVSDEGEVLVDDTLDVFDNGFVGLWLPADIEATLTVQYDGKTGTAEIGTGDDNPTCLTTVQLK
ncbi:CueP family metal-binding protein [Flaviflexus huanghaiensis]|uniref:CueP family metal-binding protein n=1 Tax=Flaviflexus huanghaiensis TaxID=1111473 RepID=UPI0015FA9F38|nr:CueP family metal-binding protein [Flaviflexus huanghaiensis]